jgi:hypothetical protein
LSDPSHSWLFFWFRFEHSIGRRLIVQLVITQRLRQGVGG